MKTSLYEGLGGRPGITRLVDDTKKDVLAILWSMKEMIIAK